MRKVRSISTGLAVEQEGLYLCCSSAATVERSRNGKPCNQPGSYGRAVDVIKHLTTMVRALVLEGLRRVVGGPLIFSRLMTLLSPRCAWAGPGPRPPDRPPDGSPDHPTLDATLDTSVLDLLGEVSGGSLHLR